MANDACLWITGASFELLSFLDALQALVSLDSLQEYLWVFDYYSSAQGGGSELVLARL
jgi:hypothetical protein